MASIHPSRLGLVPQDSRSNSNSNSRRKGRDDSREGKRTRGRMRDSRPPSPEPPDDLRERERAREDRFRHASPVNGSYRIEQPSHVSATATAAVPASVRDDANGGANMYGSRGGRRGTRGERSPLRRRSRSKSVSRERRDVRRSREREREREKDKEEKPRRNMYGSRGGGDKRQRSPSPTRSRRDEREKENRPRRRSPDYSSYKREEPPHISASAHDGANGVPANGVGNMYGSRGGGGGPRGAGGYGGGYGGGHGGGGDDYFASRRIERTNNQVNIWPPSPKAPSRDLLDTKDKKKRSKRRRSSSATSSSEDERERRRRKEKKRKEKGRDRDDKHRKKHKRERSYDDDSEEERRHRRRRARSRRSDSESSDDEEKRSRSRHKSRHSSRADTPPRSHVEEDEAEWVEKPADSFVAVAEHTGAEPHMGMNTSTSAAKPADESDDEEVGPQPAPRATEVGKRVDEREYGGALLRGEGSAMAAFLQGGDTDARIPRRGEIGLTPEEIATYESIGYVMSGSRHRRMNAVRMRKENQVISAEEKRGILKLQKEERERREAILRDEFKELVDERLKGTGSKRPDIPEDRIA